jgi:hypothetical protein
MTIDIDAASNFVGTHARLLDRYRLSLLNGTGEAPQAQAALAAYRNPDGGYGWGLEPDLRSPESQPAGALLAFELWSEAGSDADALALCDWLGSISLPDGGLPFVLPIGDPVGTAPWWAEGDHSVSSLHITTAVAGNAHRVAARDPLVAGHPWLAAATEYCLAAIAAETGPPSAHLLNYSVRFLDSIADHDPVAGDLMAKLLGHLPSDGRLLVEGGAEGESLRPLDYAPEPGRPVRELIPSSIIDDDLDRVAALQQADGGWPVDWTVSSPAAALEWRGYVTVHALRHLKVNHRLD